jgi:MFS family permease
MTALSAVLSDRAGRRRIVLCGNLVAIPWGLLLFGLMKPGDAVLFGVGLTGTLGVVGFTAGPLAACLPEMFSTRYRYTGAGIGWSLGGILGGALPLIVAPRLAAAYGGTGVGVYMAALGIVGVVSVSALRETRDVVIDESAPVAAPSSPCPTTECSQTRRRRWPRSAVAPADAALRVSGAARSTSGLHHD